MLQEGFRFLQSTKYFETHNVQIAVRVEEAFVLANVAKRSALYFVDSTT